MEVKDNGGPAFPMSAHPDHGYGPGESVKEGMTLRDWFAGQALAGLAATIATSVDGVAVYAYGIADAMLKAREQ